MSIANSSKERGTILISCLDLYFSQGKQNPASVPLALYILSNTMKMSYMWPKKICNIGEYAAWKIWQKSLLARINFGHLSEIYKIERQGLGLCLNKKIQSVFFSCTWQRWRQSGENRWRVKLLNTLQTHSWISLQTIKFQSRLTSKGQSSDVVPISAGRLSRDNTPYYFVLSCTCSARS